jgi:ABC-type transporter Mla subunit MlaD
MSIVLVSISLTALLMVAIPAMQELARAARSAEKLFDTLSRDLPPTLNAIRNTSLEITDLTDDVSEGVRSAGQVVKQVDQSLDTAKRQAQNVQIGTRSLFVGVKAAWKTFTRQKPSKRKVDRLSPFYQDTLTLREREAQRQDNRRLTAEDHRLDESYNNRPEWESNFEDEDWSEQ